MRKMHAHLLTGLLLLLSLGAPRAWASPPSAPSGETQRREDIQTSEPDPKRAKQLYATGVSELVARDFPAAYKALSDSYRVHPSLETLYQLGVLASAQGRRVDAYDIMRRFAADRGHGSTAQGTIAYPHQVEVQRMLASTPEDSGELKVVGPTGAFVFVDGRIVGVCPLSLPIFLKSGEHVIAAEYGGRMPDATIDIRAGRTGELRFDPSGRAPKVSQRSEPSVLIALATPGIPDEQKPLLRSTLTEFATRSGLTAMSADAALLNHPDLSSCLGQLACKLRLASRGSQEHILSARVTLQGAPASGQWRVSVAWINVAVGQVAAQVDLGCTICAQEQAAVLLEESAKRVIGIGLNRASGRLLVKSTPVGAEVVEGEQTLGRTPLELTLYTGVHQLVLQHPGSRSRHAAVLIESGKTRNLDVELLSTTDSALKGR